MEKRKHTEMTPLYLLNTTAKILSLLGLILLII